MTSRAARGVHRIDAEAPMRLTVTERMRAYRARNPLKEWARSQSKNKLAAGLIPRMPCQSCGAEHAEMHHEDYFRPVDVEWFCKKCHRNLHRKKA